MTELESVILLGWVAVATVSALVFIFRTERRFAATSRHGYEVGHQLDMQSKLMRDVFNELVLVLQGQQSTSAPAEEVIEAMRSRLVLALKELRSIDSAHDTYFPRS